ncbi:MAG TPA: hypothetical protein VFP35_00680 [Candidatus Saccharimonadales bacterium]|nr:hypothetical protein [Candidatus Saccharimonadales bacterium]
MTQEDIIQAVLREAQTADVPCDRHRAQQVYGLMHRAVHKVRKWDYRSPYHVTQDELDRLHPVLAVVMPDDVIEPAAGTAHDLINRHFLRRTEFSVVHTKDAFRGVEYCAVALELRAI